jgi:hypothetical protein
LRLRLSLEDDFSLDESLASLLDDDYEEEELLEDEEEEEEEDEEEDELLLFFFFFFGVLSSCITNPSRLFKARALS